MKRGLKQCIHVRILNAITFCIIMLIKIIVRPDRIILRVAVVFLLKFLFLFQSVTRHFKKRWVYKGVIINGEVINDSV